MLLELLSGHSIRQAEQSASFKLAQHVDFRSEFKPRALARGVPCTDPIIGLEDLQLQSDDIKFIPPGRSILQLARNSRNPTTN
ncbi:hypothetical protein DAI22_07g269100 [Oryza sativa Japonica Group]|nr:hypothetical protein DAI22_07g269100 [Oryza sativa Japonica Group]